MQLVHPLLSHVEKGTHHFRHTLCTIGVKLDEPAMETNSVRCSEPNVFILKTKPCRCDGIASGEARNNRDVDELLLESDEKDEASAS